MEIKNGYKNMVRVCIIEALGTCILTLAINFGSQSSTDVVIYTAEAVCVTLFCLIFLFGSISGGHFNPAVTIAVLIKEGRANLKVNTICAALIITA